MSSTIFSVLNTARLGLFANQAALGVAGNNIANVNTPGYTRQVANFESLGTGGVQIASIDRITDSFIAARTRESNGRATGSATLATTMQQMEGALGDADHSAVTQTLQAFFDALQNLSLQPSGSTERNAVRSGAQQLIFSLRSTSADLAGERTQLDQQIGQQVAQVNQLTAAIADLNARLHTVQAQPGQARTDINQLEDQRDQAIDQLSKIIPLRVVPGNDGQVTVFGANEVLVEGSTTRPVLLRADHSNQGMHDVIVADVAGQSHSLAGQLDSGSLGALLQARDVYGKGLVDQIDQLAAQLVRDTNVQHRQGVGLDGVGGRDFYAGLAVTGAARPENKGGATVASSSVLDDTQLTFQDYEIRFTGAAQFDVVNTTTGATVAANQAYTPGGAIDFGGMRVVIDNTGGAPAAGDVFAIDSYRGTTTRMDLSVAVAADPAAIAAGLTNAPGDNQNALSLAGMGTRASMGQPPTRTFGEFFDAVRLNLGMASQSAQTAQASDAAAQQQVASLRDAVSGVSTDEEATNIIQYQRAFEASSRVISVTDQMLQALLQIL